MLCSLNINLIFLTLFHDCFRENASTYWWWCIFATSMCTFSREYSQFLPSIESKWITSTRGVKLSLVIVYDFLAVWRNQDECNRVEVTTNQEQDKEKYHDCAPSACIVSVLLPCFCCTDFCACDLFLNIEMYILHIFLFWQVVIVPGYGLAVAGAQYAIADAVKILTKHGVKVWMLSSNTHTHPPPPPRPPEVFRLFSSRRFQHNVMMFLVCFKVYCCSLFHVSGLDIGKNKHTLDDDHILHCHKVHCVQYGI